MESIDDDTHFVSIETLEFIWAETKGDPNIRIAVIDGPVDRDHSSLVNANIDYLPPMYPEKASDAAYAHGTHVTSIIFGQHESPVKGIAPYCSGIVIPVFSANSEGAFLPCSQLDLVRAITLAVDSGANIINISGGQLSPSGKAHPLLSQVVKRCAEQRVLIVAAAGNQGCECLHIPGALPSVLVVGAMNAHGHPLPFSNWGKSYLAQGVLAPGEEILGAKIGSGTAKASGTSYATPIVAGVVALLMSLAKVRGSPVDSYAARDAIINSSLGCEYKQVANCDRLLAGRLNISGAVAHLIRGDKNMSQDDNNGQPHLKRHDAIEIAGSQEAPLINTFEGNPRTDDARGIQPSQFQFEGFKGEGHFGPAIETAASQQRDITNSPKLSIPSGLMDHSVFPAACSCQGATPQLVYALGQIGFDFGSEARRDRFIADFATLDPPQAVTPESLAKYVEHNPASAEGVIWLLQFDIMPIFAIQPSGPNADRGYTILREFITDALERARQYSNRDDPRRILTIAIPGHIVGSVRLLSGQTVPVLRPVVRGMTSWNTEALTQRVSKQFSEDKQEAARIGTVKFLNRIYYQYRNMGVTPEDRALNYAGTDFIEAADILTEALGEGFQLDDIRVTKSSYCRPESDCWDIQLVFYFPKDIMGVSRRVYSYTVDVSDVIPVLVGFARTFDIR